MNIEKEEKMIDDFYSELLFNKKYNELNNDEILIYEKYIRDMLSPIWKKIIIDGKETIYSISNVGVIRNDLKNTICHSTEITDKNNNKYQSVMLSIDKVKIRKYIHRLVAEAFIPNPDNKPEVNHRNGNKLLNWVDNLEWNTRLENAQHASRSGLMKLGSSNSSSKYTEKDAHKVCELMEKGLGAEEISKKLKVSKSFVVGILYRGEWKSVSKYYKIPEHKTFSDEEIIHKICKEFENGKRTCEIVNDLNVDRRLVESIKYGKAWRRISNQYDIPGLDKVNNLPERSSTKIRNLISQGIIDTNEIIRLLDLPDTKGQKKYIAKIKRNMNSIKGSSTIETLQ